MYDALRGRRGDDGVVNVVADILDFALSTPDPVSYLTDVRDDQSRFAELDGILDGRRAKIAASANLLKRELDGAGMSKHAVVTGEFVDYIDGKIDDITATSFRAQGDARDILNERFKALKAECKELRAAYDEAAKAKAVNSAPYARALCAVALDALNRYGKRKEQTGKTDYSDLEHGALRVLENSDCMREIADGVKYVFIDEFQDVNPLQARIAQKFKDAGAEMFVVGDVKAVHLRISAVQPSALQVGGGGRRIYSRRARGQLPLGATRYRLCQQGFRQNNDRRVRRRGLCRRKCGTTPCLWQQIYYGRKCGAYAYKRRNRHRRLRRANGRRDERQYLFGGQRRDGEPTFGRRGAVHCGQHYRLYRRRRGVKLGRGVNAIFQRAVLFCARAGTGRARNTLFVRAQVQGKGFYGSYGT